MMVMLILSLLMVSAGVVERVSEMKLFLMTGEHISIVTVALPSSIIAWSAIESEVASFYEMETLADIDEYSYQYFHISETTGKMKIMCDVCAVRLASKSVCFFLIASPYDS
jgi:hypothetical protein